MRIAVCFSGQIRTGFEASKNILNYIGELLPYTDFFIHTWDTENVAYVEYIEDQRNFIGLSQEEIERTEDRHFIEKIPPIKLSEVRINNYINVYSPKKYKIDNYNSYMKSLLLIKLPPIYYSWFESNKLKMEFEKENNFKYDLVVKLRPDIIFHSKRSLKNDIENLDISSNKLFVWRWDTINVPNAIIKIEDVHFLGNSEVLDKVTSFIDAPNETFHNHTDRQILHYNYVDSLGIEIISFISKDFIVFRYYQYDSKIPFDELITNRFRD